MILQVHVNIWPCDYDYKSPKESHHPVKFFGHKHWDSGDIMVLVCHGINGSYDVMGSIPSR